MRMLVKPKYVLIAVTVVFLLAMTLIKGLQFRNAMPNFSHDTSTNKVVSSAKIISQSLHTARSAQTSGTPASLTSFTSSQITSLTPIFTTVKGLSFGKKTFNRYKSVFNLDNRDIMADEIGSNSIPRQNESELFTLVEKHTEYARRREHVNAACKNHTILASTPYPSSNDYLIEMKHKIVYCPIPKVGSTFWKRALTISGVTAPPNLTLYELSLRTVRLTKLSELSGKVRLDVMKHGMSFLFVRDPYARLFSAYENKIYHSNMFYWHRIGKRIVQFIRRPTHHKIIHYGFDVTFLEFIQYVLYLYETDKYMDQHFRPMFQLCNPCIHKFDFIGRLESFKVDYAYLIKTWKLNYTDIDLSMDDISNSKSIMDTATGHVRFLYETKSILRIIQFPFKSLMLRSWRDLQIRGYISKYLPFPYENIESVDRVEPSDFLAEIEMGIKYSTNIPSVKSQREEALIQAYRTIPLEVMDRLEAFVKEDCKLFGFDSRPDTLFDRSKPFHVTFNYLDGLKD